MGEKKSKNNNKKKKNQNLSIFLVMCAVIVLAAGFGVLVLTHATRATGDDTMMIIEGEALPWASSIATVAFGGRDSYDATNNMLNRTNIRLANGQLTFVYMDEEFKFSLTSLLNDREYEEEPFTFSTEKIESALYYINSQLAIEPIRPHVTRENGQFIVGDVTDGSRIIVEEALEHALEFLENDILNPRVYLRREVVANSFASGTFANANNLLGTFTSHFSAGSSGRNTNIRNASDFVHGTILLPGEVFSTNQTIGPVTVANGYAVGTVILNGEFVDGVGGGVCQVSTNLYMAVLFAELEIVQRRNHSRMVAYVPPAFDAVLAAPYLDLRFRNNTNYPIFIESITGTSSHTINIFGNETRASNRNISFESVRTATAETTRTYQLIKVVTQNGVTSRQVVNTSVYNINAPSQSSTPVAVNEPAPATPPPPAETPPATLEPTPPQVDTPPIVNTPTEVAPPIENTAPEIVPPIVDAPSEVPSPPIADTPTEVAPPPIVDTPPEIILPNTEEDDSAIE